VLRSTPFFFATSRAASMIVKLINGGLETEISAFYGVSDLGVTDLRNFLLIKIGIVRNCVSFSFEPAR
jgi:hypothetical protein